MGKTTNTVSNTNNSVKATKIGVPLKYLSNFWTSLEMTLLNCKIHLELNYIENYILSSTGDSVKSKITNAKLHDPTVTFFTKNNVNLTKQLRDGFILAKVINQGTNIYELGSSSFQDVKRLFVLTYAIVAGAAKNEADIKNNIKYFLPRAKIENYNVLIGAINFYEQPINDLIKQYDEVRKVSTGQSDDYSTEYLLDYVYFKDNYRLIAADLSKQKNLPANPRVSQQTVFQGVAGGADNTKIRLYTVLEKLKETVLEFYKGSFVNI